MATNPSITISGTLHSDDNRGELLRSKLATRTDDHLVDEVQVRITIDGEVLVFTLDPVEIHLKGPAPSPEGKS